MTWFLSRFLASLRCRAGVFLLVCCIVGAEGLHVGTTKSIRLGQDPPIKVPQSSASAAPTSKGPFVRVSGTATTITTRVEAATVAPPDVEGIRFRLRLPQQAKDLERPAPSSSFPSLLPSTVLEENKKTEQAVSKPQSKQESVETKRSINIGLVLGMAYFCTELCCRSPVVLLPTIAEQQANLLGATFSRTAFVASVASTSFLGGGIGKFINGIICQAMGGKRSASACMAGIGICSLLLSFNTATHMFGPLLGAMEFFMSARWMACVVIFASHFQGNAAKMAAAVTTMSLMSTSGQVCAKVMGTLLLSVLGSWELVALLGSFAAFTGAAIAHFMVDDKRSEHEVEKFSVSQDNNKVTHEKREKISVLAPMKEVLSSRLFWMVSIGHLAGFLTTYCDKILSSFYVEAAGLPVSVSGGLTISCTLGLVHGLSRGRKFFDLPDSIQKMSSLRRNYARGVLAALGLALCGGPWLSHMIPSKTLFAGILALLSATISSSLSFQFYQIPGMMLGDFQQSKAVFLGLTDGVCYIAGSQIFKAMGFLASSLKYGWPVAWCGVATMIALGGNVMLRNIEPVLKKA